ncbi:transient receptor potential cation channel trpm-like isoform X1 [Penaeus chinensis]|uniref:transient receptor potential cation channel trpm-like isoform X1 n=1 Tax=Penaeus chinensis TaxID=139456 RepID=UPI001FB7280D|nr:transient receptor potential cation channel trpm-like isoform X1 [Penaeus chinensis]XP_047469380.1 transient receptor potential cation channel trpm-like isoform X1 [Penaeus chinensis]XP_047469381.1 transient receptor potential cation channel trpm-like isoform X1 [Penaeus chinensis]
MAGARWIELVFNKRECIKFIPSSKDNARCCCGQLWQFHRDGSPATLRQSQELHWSPSRHTQLQPTDAYGTLEFQGGAHPTKAQYIRLAHDTRPEHILQLLTGEWGLDLPKLLITVQGGKTNFDLQPKLKKVIRKGLLKAAKTTGAWVFTAGTNTGVSRHMGVTRHVGEALVSESSLRVRGGRVVSVGIAPWGIIERRQDLIGRNKDVPYIPINAPKSRFVALNSHHTFFLLVDNGTIGKYGPELILRRKLENYISKQRIEARGGLATPVVCVVIEGGPQTIRQVLEYVTDSPPVPVIVCDGTGRAADILAFVHKYASSGLNLIEANRDTIILTLERVFEIRPSQAEKLFTEVLQCVRKRDLITVFRLKEGCELDQSILSALLHAQRLNPPEQLSLALTWNRVDIARSHVFNEDVEWPEGSLEQAMMDALVNDRIEFVKLLLEQGVTMTKFLTIQRLEELYNSKQGPANTLRYIIRDVKKNIPRDYRYTLIDIGLVINKLMGGAYRSFYSRKKFRTCYENSMARSPRLQRINSHIFHNSKSLLQKSSTSPKSFNNLTDLQSDFEFEYPFSELLVWAVLTKRQGMAMLMWQHGEEATAKALVAAKLYKALAHEAADDDLETEVYEELRSYAKEFEALALHVLDYCYQQDDDRAQQLLTYELRNWSKQTCLSLAVAVNHRALLSHPCCQILLADLWLGGLRTRKNTNVKVMLSLLCPPLILVLGFRSREELKTMPQTREEHQEEDPLRSSDSESDTDSDEENMDMRNDHDPETGRPASVTSTEMEEMEGEYNVDAKAQLVHSVSLVSHPVTPTLQAEAPLCNSSNAAQLSSACLSPPASEAPTTVDGNDTTVRQNGASMGHLSVLDSTVFTDLHSKQLPARTKFYEFYNAPISKFWAHSMAYVFFLCLFTYLVLVKLPKKPQWMEWYVVAYISTLLLEKIREILSTEPVELKQKIAVWSDKLWNVFDLIFTILFLIGLCLRLQDQTMQAGRVIYCVDIIYWYLRVLEILSANKYLGPLVMMMGKMIKNMAYFVVLLLVVLMAFGVCRQSILFPNEEPHWRLARHIFYQPYFMLYGEVFAGDIDPECGEDKEVPCHPGRWITPTVMSMYLLVANILLINLLIAVFNNIFTSVNAISHQVWMFQRFQVVMEFEEKPVFPPPLIILSHIHRAIKYCFRRWKGKPFLYDNGLKLFLDGESLERVHDFEEECVDGYNREKEQKEQMSTEERVRVMAERSEALMQRVEDMHGKFLAAMSSLNSLDFHVKRLEEIAEQTKNSYAVVHRFMLSHVGRPRRSSSPRSGSASPRSDGGTPRSLSQSSLHQLLEEAERQMLRKPLQEPETSDKEQSDTTDAEHEAANKFLKSSPTAQSSREPGKSTTVDEGIVRGFSLDPVNISAEAKKVKTQGRRKTRLDSESGSSLGRASRERKLSGERKSSIRKSSRKGSDGARGFSPSRVCFMDINVALEDSDSGDVDVKEKNLNEEDEQPRYGRSVSVPDEAAVRSPTRYERSLSSVSSRPRIQVIPPSSPPPIFTFTSEYTSLADELETACMARLSPPSSPNLHYPHRSDPHLRRRHFSESASISITICPNPLRDAEEADYQLMEGLIQRRMHRDSENLAVSLEDLCSVQTDMSDNEEGVTPMRSRRGSRAAELRKRHSTSSLDNAPSQLLVVPGAVQMATSYTISPTTLQAALRGEDGVRLASSTPGTPGARRSSLRGDMHHQWASSSALPASGGWLSPRIPRPRTPPFIHPDNPASSSVDDEDARNVSQDEEHPHMSTLQVPSIRESEGRPRDTITETEC